MKSCSSLRAQSETLYISGTSKLVLYVFNPISVFHEDYSQLTS